MTLTLEFEAPDVVAAGTMMVEMAKIDMGGGYPPRPRLGIWEKQDGQWVGMLTAKLTKAGDPEGAPGLAHCQHDFSEKKKR